MRGEDQAWRGKKPEIRMHLREINGLLTMLVDICLVLGQRMKRYLSTATKRMEMEEKKTQVD